VLTARLDHMEKRKSFSSASNPTVQPVAYSLYQLSYPSFCYICNASGNSEDLDLASVLYSIWSRDSVVGIATSYGLDDRGVGVRIPVG
jgi:hypothetical protein